MIRYIYIYIHIKHSRAKLARNFWYCPEWSGVRSHASPWCLCSSGASA